ncbi:MAG: hypothetical protein GXP31_13310 [Kiritimatiellaeota bacterium]|nr:hypothetical protein [Kiritimatiellota bacterium]
MPVDFDAGRWERVRENSARWWAGELDRPLVQVRVGGREPGRPAPALPFHHFTAFYEDDVTPEQIVDCWDYSLSCTHFLGDAFPSVWPNFGPGVLAVLVGGRMESDGATVWFMPDRRRDIREFHFEFRENVPVLHRIKAICRAACERWEGRVQIGMTDLGGAVDVASTFRPGEQLLLDLYDHPDEVKRVVWELHDLWWRAFRDIDSVLRPVNPGYTAWTPIFSEQPYYMLQCDFCYMIGPDMFDEFVKPELAASCRKLVNPFYHLDGPGEIPHLDSLLSIPELKGIQWVPGAGAPPCTEWHELYRRIHEAGKLIQVFGTIETLDTIAEQVGTGKGIVLVGTAPAERMNDVHEFLDKYGAA